MNIKTERLFGPHTPHGTTGRYRMYRRTPERACPHKIRDMAANTGVATLAQHILTFLMTPKALRSKRFELNPRQGSVETPRNK